MIADNNEAVRAAQDEQDLYGLKKKNERKRTVEFVQISMRKISKGGIVNNIMP